MSELNFNARVAIVTGAGQGMGREYAKMLASRGARVVVNDLNADNAAATVAEITEAGGIAVADTHNVTVGAADIIQTALTSFGSLDIVVNNAGVNSYDRFWEQDPQVWWNVFDINFRGTAEVARHAMPHLIASGSGRLINTASNAMMGSPQSSAYGAAKAAIWGLGNTLAEEAREVGVQVSTLLPVAWTPMTAEFFQNPSIQDAMREELPASAVAAFVTWLAHQDTTVGGETFEVAGVSAARTTFAAQPRMRVTASTPEAWADHAEHLMEDGALTPLPDASASFNGQLVFLAPEMEKEIAAEMASS